MKNQIRVGLFVAVSLFIFQVSTTYATDYNYLPNDVFIKQQEEKSALEYRLKTLENQYRSNPQASIFSIEQRISELQRQKDTEKEYLKGMLAKNGAYSPEAWASYSAKTDAKYDSQISSLNQQKSSYQSQVSNQQQKDQEIERLRKELLEIIDRQADSERQRVLDELKEKQQKLDEEYKSKNSVNYSDEEVLLIFNHLDSLPLKEASAMHKVLIRNNDNLADKIKILYDKKYPNGKTDISKSDKDTTTSQKAYTPEIKKEVPLIKTVKPVVKQEIKKTQVKATSTEEKIIPIVRQEQPIIQPVAVDAQKPTEIKTTIKEKVSGFFKKVFWR